MISGKCSKSETTIPNENGDIGGLGSKWSQMIPGSVGLIKYNTTRLLNMPGRAGFKHRLPRLQSNIRTCATGPAKKPTDLNANLVIFFRDELIPSKGANYFYYSFSPKQNFSPFFG